MKLLDNLIDKLFVKQWNVGVARIGIDDLLKKGHNHLQYKWLPISKKTRFYADPFIFKNDDGNLNIIYEDFSGEDQYGKISMTTVDEKFNPVFQKEMLDTSSHLSYPYVFCENGKTYIIPEASKSGQVICYQYDFATKSLINKCVLINNLPLLDSTIFKQGDIYWLFGTMRGPHSNSKLYIYYSDKLEGPYLPHAGNPVKNSLSGTRPAGRIIQKNGELFRPTQNSAQYYGKSILLNRIKLLTKEEFFEETVAEIKPPQRGGFNYAIHTINFLDDVIVIDSLRRIFMPFEQIRRFINKNSLSAVAVNLYTANEWMLMENISCL